MSDALTAARNGMPVKTAAKKFNVPKTTLLYKYKGKYPESRHVGPDTKLTKGEEELLVVWIRKSKEAGFPVSKNNFLFSVQKLAEELGKPFTNGSPGRKWYEGFMARHPGLSLRVSQNLTSSRASVTTEHLKSWFEEVEAYLKANKLEHVLEAPNSIFNADETAFFLSPKGERVLACKGDKTVYNKVASNEKECVTALLTGSAAGIVAPPMVILQYQRVPAEVAASIPPHWGVGCSDNGWSTCEVFYCYMVNIFYPWALEESKKPDPKVSFPILFFLDGHASHFSYHLSKFCSEHDIVLIALYPNATQYIQPMDVSVFRTLKAGWREIINKWRGEHHHDTVRKSNFAPILAKAIHERVTPSVLINGFRKCGLFPWKPSAVDSITFKNLTRESAAPVPGRSHEQQPLNCLERFLEPNKIELFKKLKRGDPDCTLPIEDTSLFQVWKSISFPESASEPANPQPSTSTSTSVRRGHVVGLYEKTPEKSVSPTNRITPEAANPQPSTSSTCTSISVRRGPVVSEKTPEKSVLPSPFKKALTWPGTPPPKQNKRQKEKIPSVISSGAWQAYYQRKKLEKDKKNEEKLNRKRMREEKKKQKEQLLALKKADKKRKRLSSTSSDSSVDYSEHSEFEAEDFTEDFEIGDFVIVSYDGQMFPGQIEKEEGEEFFISTMQRAGQNGWKWPEKEDAIWYRKADVRRKITPPSTANARGVCIVSELL